MRNKISKLIKLHKRLVNDFEKEGLDKIIKISNILTEALKQEGVIYLCGNGGSAADAQHIAGEFIGRFKKERKALPAISLTTDTSVITCIGNDFGFDYIFYRQVEALVRPKDILWVLSTSGLSKNIIAAAKLVKEKGAKVIAFVGKQGSELEKISDICLNVNSSVTCVVQEIHQLAYHIISDLVEQRFVKD